MPVLGYVLNNTHLNDSLLRAVAATTVRVYDNTRVSAISQSIEHVTVHCQKRSSTLTPGSQGNEEFEICAKLLIAADGSSSSIRDWAGIGTHYVDYEQIAVMNTVSFERPHHGVAYERFTESGPLAFLPRGQTRMSVVNCIQSDDRSAVEAMHDDRYRQHLQQRFGGRLGRITGLGHRIYVPLVRIEARTQSAERVLLMGNALRLLHPVGGQGYNLAIRDVATLVKLLDRNADAAGAVASEDPGSSLLLSTYTDKRRADQRRVTQFTDLLARGFRGSASLPAHLRGFSLTLLDSVSPLRRGFAAFTTGRVD